MAELPCLRLWSNFQCCQLGLGRQQGGRQLLVLMEWLTITRELYRILGVLLLVIRVWAGYFYLFMHRTEFQAHRFAK